MSSHKHYACSVTVETAFVPDQSDVSQNRYVFSYTVTVTNTGSVAAQLISRHWIITDADDHTQEVRGLGVVGEQPLLQPGESFRYTSGTVLATPVGTMHGSYTFVDDGGERFEVPIPLFVLAAPRTLH